MPVDDDDSRMAFLRNELEAALAMNNLLEKENVELKQEVSRLKAQVSALKAHDNERKSILWKKLQNSMDSISTERFQEKATVQSDIAAKSRAVESSKPAEGYLESAAEKEKPRRVPQPPPPRPTTSAPSHKVNEYKVPSPTAPPPPPPLPRNLLVPSKAVRRVPEVMEFYRSLMKRDAQKDSTTSPRGTSPAINPRNMIGEIENRSTHLLAVSVAATCL